jgi:ketosteroid isomerase-like protein
MPGEGVVRKYLIVLVSVVFLTGAASGAAPGAVAIPTAAGEPPPPFRAAVEAHLAAVSARNMKALLPTLTGENDLVMIAPNGFKYDTRDQYVAFHEQWFASKDRGRLSAEIVHLIESPTMGHALVKYRYSFVDPTDKPQSIDSWLTLTFKLEYGRWRLVFDQNTPIAPR